jgi:hypothetical protein
MAALALSGDRIEELAAYTPAHGWVPARLEEPARGKVEPVQSASLMAFPIGTRIYAFSPQAGKWGVLTLDGQEVATPIMENYRITVRAGRILAVFSARTGAWSTVDLGAAEE